MVYSKQNSAFKSDKNQFFLQLPKKDMVISSAIEKVETRANHIGYTFLLQNQKALEDEFVHTFAVLQKQKDNNNEAFWLYCYYCATLLENFYKAYSQQSKEEEYKNLRQKIKNRLLKVKEDAVAEEVFIESLKNSYISGFRNLMSSPFHISRIRDYVAYSNLCRVYWVFCRLTMTTGLALAKDLQIIDKLDAILGTHTDVDKIISVIQAPNGILNYFSVGFFLMRFMIDAGLLIRHTFFPTEQEKKDKTTALERFKYELYKRHCNFANDLVWATVNFLTNFNHITHIPGPIAGAITAVFLGFDVCMTLYKCQLAKQEYLIKKAQYEQEIEKYSKQLKKLTDINEVKNAAAHIAMLQAQLKELEIGWRTKQGTFYFVASAAALLMLGFTAALLFTPPGIIVASFFVCTLATAMYLSAGAYSTFQEKSLRLEQAQLSGNDLDMALKEYQAARNDFIFTMVKNTVMPALLITTFAICWPAAIVLTAMYVGYEIYHAYDQHKSKKEAAQLALAAPFEKKTSQIPLTTLSEDKESDVSYCYS
ncbi:coiled-coil protein [Legionella gratiana]|uniref:Coiled-coil protein n=1 Tax=Legionella gratiana TaxID=45066 RepID=A0A378JF97_9GAMM|nr:hypothetical protein [Legionella gratiana]KTD11835.1 coiled-coil protein [Legionella gratiana]STX46574.1 coiled-coil protein [Legionella gratiana]